MYRKYEEKGIILPLYWTGPSRKLLKQISLCTLPSSSTVILPLLSQSKSLKASLRHSTSCLDSCLSGLSLSVFLVMVIWGQVWGPGLVTMGHSLSPDVWLSQLTTTPRAPSLSLALSNTAWPAAGATGVNIHYLGQNSFDLKLCFALECWEKKRRF